MSLASFILREGYDSAWIRPLIDLHNKTEMQRRDETRVDSAFAASTVVVTAWIEDRLIGCGRMISDGQMYSSIFDVVIDPDFQKRGVGRALMERLISKAPGTCFHLTSTFGNEDFYSKLGFRKHKTAMALYPPAMAATPYLEPLLPIERIAQPRIETKRLILEPYRDQDAQDIFEYASNPEVTRYLLWPAHRTVEDSRDFLKMVKTWTSHVKGKLFFTFALRLKATGKVIGSIDFKNPQPWTGQIDYVLARDHWGNGLMPEAAQALRDWALATFPDLERLQSFCDVRNTASARVMEKIGLQFEGIRKKSFQVQGRRVDLAHYAWTKEDSRLQA